MEGGAVLERLTRDPGRAPGGWQVGTVTAIRNETSRVKSFLLELQDWRPHLPGQHYDVRLSAPDGYQAQRSYSVASSPLDTGVIELTVERLDGGEVSTYLHDEVVVGDRVEVRGPLATYFVWRGEAPVLLVAGGSGVVPLMSMLRHRRRTSPGKPMRLLYSVRSAQDVVYAGELGEETLLTFTREAPRGWTGHRGRIDRSLVAEECPAAALTFVCGSNPFVEAAAGLLVDAGFDPARIRTERFGSAA